MVNKNNLQKVGKWNYLGIDIFLKNSLGSKQFWSRIKLLPLYIVGSPRMAMETGKKRPNTTTYSIW
jgi:hypothetical protein